jgi:hypothetical protein
MEENAFTRQIVLPFFLKRKKNKSNSSNKTKKMGGFLLFVKHGKIKLDKQKCISI